jgi:hypothetical protein
VNACASKGTLTDAYTFPKSRIVNILSPNISLAYPGFFLAAKVLEPSVNHEKRDFQRLSNCLV